MRTAIAIAGSAADAQRGAAPCRFYFAYCEAAFDARYLHNFQILWEKSSEPDAAATSRAPMGPSELPKQAVPPLQSPPSDPTTQVSGWKYAPFICGTSCLRNFEKWKNRTCQSLCSV